MAGRRARLDAELVRRELAPSRTAARALIDAGDVRVEGVAVPKPASQVAPDQAIEVVASGPRWASRGGLKLDGALEDLGVDVTGAVALDAGAAHGGFTDVLLHRGAAAVVAVDVAYGQLAWHLRTDPRVLLLERTNVRDLAPADLDGHVPDLVVADLSFISLAKVLDALTAVITPGAVLLPMVKPQFEAGRTRVGRGGVVRDPDVWADVLTAVAEAAQARGMRLLGAAPSRAPGPAGNVEFFLHLVRGQPPSDPAEVVAAAVRAGVALSS